MCWLLCYDAQNNFEESAFYVFVNLLFGAKFIEKQITVNKKMLEDFSLADSVATEGSLMSHLWEMCEASQSTVKLILPDTLNPPFYLPKIPGRKSLTVAQQEREDRRNEFLSQRDISALIPSKGKRHQIPTFKFHMKKDM